MRAGGIPDSSRRRRSRPSPKIRSKKDRGPPAAAATNEETTAAPSGASSATNSATPSPTPVSGTATAPAVNGTAASAATDVPAANDASTSCAEATVPNEDSSVPPTSPPSSESQPASPTDSGIDAKDGEGEGPPQTGGQVISMQGEQRMDDEVKVSQI